MKTLIDHGHRFIFRMKKNSHWIQNMKNKRSETDLLVHPKYGGLKTVQYTADNTTYYLLTNIFHHSVETYQHLYHQRWSVEEYFKTLKNNLKMRHINSKSLNNIQQELNIQLIISMLSRFLEKCATKYYNSKNSNTIINNKNSLQITGNYIFYYLLFKKSNQKIVDCLVIILTEQVTSQQRRHFKRRAIKPPSKWYFCGILLK